MIASKTPARLSRNADSRSFLMQPHGYYDSAAEIVEKGQGKGAELWRSKTRCSAASEWMEVGDASDGEVLWRIESRYGDRCVPHTTGKEGSPETYITVLRVYRRQETKPLLLLVYRSRQGAGITSSGSHKDVEVYMCSDDDDAKKDLVPRASSPALALAEDADTSSANATQAAH